MGIKELAAQVQAARPSVSLADVTAVLNQAMKLLREELRTTSDKAVRLGPLGQVRISEKTAEPSEGGSTAAPTRRLVLRLAPATAKSAEGAAGKPAGAKKAKANKLKAGKPGAAKKAKLAAKKKGQKAQGAGTPNDDTSEN